MKMAQKVSCHLLLVWLLVSVLHCGADDAAIDDIISEIFSSASDKPAVTPRKDTVTPRMNAVTEGSDADNAFDDLIEDIFGESPVTPKMSVDDVRSPMQKINPCKGKGECVPYYQCLNGSIITAGETLLDARLGADDDPHPEKHPCPDFFETCCLERSAKPIVAPFKPIVQPEKCGFRNDNGVVFELKPRDNEAQFAEFPWAIALLYRTEASGVTVKVYLCGGSLIHPSAVLTAAHCAMKKKADEFIVRAGEWDSQRTTEPFPHIDRDVREVLIHEKFQQNNLFNDIALLFLVAPIEMAPNINTACLPPPETVYDDRNSIANGWGKDKFNDGTYQAIMKRINVPVVSHKICEKRLRVTRLGRRFTLGPGFLCAGGQLGIDTCTGDGGSPLVTKIDGTDNQYYQIGIVSWGISCGMETPGVYVDVSKYRNWIDEIFKTRSLDTAFYMP